MQRSLSTFASAFAVASALAVAGCEAEVDEGCFGGPCGSDTAPPMEQPTDAGSCERAETGSFPCAVYEALKAKCHTCHTNPTLNGAPFPLLTYEDTVPVYVNAPRFVKMQAAIESGFMPLGMAPDLTPEEREAVLSWLGSCAPAVPEGQGCECTDPAACP